MSPTIYRERGYAFYFYMYDLREPAHVHVRDGRRPRSDDAKIWLDPVSVARAGRFDEHELGQMIGIIEANLSIFLEGWNRYAQQR